MTCATCVVKLKTETKQIITHTHTQKPPNTKPNQTTNKKHPNIAKQKQTNKKTPNKTNKQPHTHTKNPPNQSILWQTGHDSINAVIWLRVAWSDCIQDYHMATHQTGTNWAWKICSRYFGKNNLTLVSTMPNHGGLCSPKANNIKLVCYTTHLDRNVTTTNKICISCSGQAEHNRNYWTAYKRLIHKMQGNTKFKHYLKMYHPVQETYCWKQTYHNLLEQAHCKGKKKYTCLNMSNFKGTLQHCQE